MFTIGCDPECFLGKDGAVRSVIGLIGGTKDNPKPLPIGPGFGVQEDNVALEYTVPPSSSKGEFVQNIKLVMGFLATTVKDQYGLEFVKESAISFPDSELAHPAAHVFGCDPDFNAWTGRRNPRPRASDRNLRSAGGHVHIGMENLGLKQKRSIIRACDLFLGIPSVLMDKGELRKQLYGKAGAFRDKPYGVEYRTLSNFWVFEDRLIEWVYNGVVRATTWDEPVPDTVEAIINSNDKAAAEAMVHEFGLEVA